MAQPIVIDGVTLPTPKKGGVTITVEKIWSKNTGRAARGNMIGDIVAYKHTIKIEWPPLSREDTAKIDKAVTPAFFNVTFLSPGTNTRITREFYAGTPTYSVYSYVNGMKTYQGVSVDLIEQ